MTDMPNSQDKGKNVTTVAETMTRDVITIEPTATVREAVKMMRRNKTSSLIVERRDAADEYGLVVVSDIAGEVLSKNLSPDRVNVYEVMSKPVLTVSAGMNVVYATRLLTRFKLSRALVIDDERTPLGIVTLRDMVLRAIEDEEAD